MFGWLRDARHERFKALSASHNFSQAGATINLQTKTGTKDYHGSAYEFNQNAILNANMLQANLIGAPVAPVHFKGLPGPRPLEQRRTSGGIVLSGNVGRFSIRVWQKP